MWDSFGLKKLGFQTILILSVLYLAQADYHNWTIKICFCVGSNPRSSCERLSKNPLCHSSTFILSRLLLKDANKNCTTESTPSKGMFGTK